MSAIVFYVRVVDNMVCVGSVISWVVGRSSNRSGFG